MYVRVWRIYKKAAYLSEKRAHPFEEKDAPFLSLTWDIYAGRSETAASVKAMCTNFALGQAYRLDQCFKRIELQ